MSSNQYTVNIVNADELYIGGRKIQALELGVLVSDDASYGVGIGTDKPRLKLDISGNSGIRIPVGTTAVRPTNTTLTGSGATNLLGVLRYNTTTEKYEAVYDHESLSVNPSWCNFVIETGTNVGDNKVGINRGTTAPLQTLDVNGQIGINDYIIHNGDTDTYFGFLTDNTFHIYTGGSERMRVASNGYIGIGTINAASLLHVFNATDTTLDLSLYSMNRYTSAPNTATNICYNYLENTLVSNSAPPSWGSVPRYGFKLGSWRNLTSSGLILKTVHNAAAVVDWKTRLKVNNDGFFYFNSPDPTQSNPAIHSHNYYSPYHFSFKPTTNNKYGDLPPSANNYNSKINDLTFSNFGIVQADSKNIFGEYPVFIGKGCTLYSDNNPTLASTKFIAFSKEGSPSSNSQTFYGGGIMLNDKIHFITYNTSNINPGNKFDAAGNTIYDGLELQLSSYTRMTIDETGNVGIGTTTPRCRLDVSGVGMFKSPGPGNNGLIVESDSHGVGINHNHIGMVDTSHDFYIQYPGTGNTILNYDGGNVGIGTGNPGAKLDVNGNGRFNGQVKIGNFSVSGQNTDKQVLQITAGVRQISIGGDGNNTYIKAHKNDNYNVKSYLDIIGNRLNLFGDNGEGITVTENGDVGIGTTNNAGAKLEVIGGIKCANSSYCSKRDSQHFDTYTSNGTTGSPMYLNWYSKSEVYISKIRFGYTGNDFGGGWYMADTTWIRNYNYKPVYLNVGSYNSIALEVQGRVLIGSGTPKFPLHITAYQDISYYDYGGTGQFHGNYITSIGSSGWGSTSKYYNGHGSRYVSLKTDYGIWNSGDYFHSSDERIKENILDVSDNVALQQLRDISCCFYEYKDKVIKGTDKTIGFIAQQVREHMPMAVSIQKGIIPNEMRKIENPQWTMVTDASGNNTYKLTIPDLEDASGNTSETTKYKFYVSNDPSGNDECEKEITSLENDPKSFIFEEQWQNVFLYGKEVNDFHTIDKQKLFALNFSASQEIDKIQQQEKTKLEEQTLKLVTAEAKIAASEAKIAASEAKIAASEAKIAASEAKIAASEAEIATLKTTLVDVLSRLAALEN